MKKLLIILIAGILSMGAAIAQSQKFAYVDTDYILKNIPSYRQLKLNLIKSPPIGKKKLKIFMHKSTKCIKIFRPKKCC